MRVVLAVTLAVTLGLADAVGLRRGRQYYNPLDDAGGDDAQGGAVPAALDPDMDTIVAAAKKMPAKLWPLPQSIKRGDKDLTVTPSANFFSVAGSSPLLSEAFERYAKYTFPHAANSGSSGAGPKITGLELVVADKDESHPQLDTDESYTLKVPATGGKAKAPPRRSTAPCGRSRPSRSWCASTSTRTPTRCRVRRGTSPTRRASRTAG